VTIRCEPDVRYVVPVNLTEEQIAEAKEKLHELAKALGRVSAQVCHKMGIHFDLDDPEVAREVMKMTFEGLFYSPPPARRGTRKAHSAAPTGLPE
jgi:hypothetical protein